MRRLRRMRMLRFVAILSIIAIGIALYVRYERTPRIVYGVSSTLPSAQDLLFEATPEQNEAYLAEFASLHNITPDEAADALRLDLYPLQYNGAPDIPTLQTITQGAKDDAEALDLILEYYTTHTRQLSEILGETHPDRLAALFAMYVVHISHNYGVRLAPESLLAYLGAENSHCGMYSRYQAQILDAMGLTWRVFAHDGAEHAWIEVSIDGQWEAFDATVNVWLSIGGYELLAAKPREYRLFYTPMNDLMRPDARQHILVPYNMPRLRLWMPQFGLTYAPDAAPHQIGISASAPGQGSAVNTPWYRWYDTNPPA